MGQEKRKSRRKPMRYKVWLQAGQDQLSCTMSDVSSTGARLDVDVVDDVPERFVLLLSQSGQPRRLCRVVWRSTNQVGVHFEIPGETHVV
jgi:hypothetical protein